MNKKIIWISSKYSKAEDQQKAEEEDHIEGSQILKTRMIRVKIQMIKLKKRKKVKVAIQIKVL